MNTRALAALVGAVLSLTVLAACGGNSDTAAPSSSPDSSSAAAPTSGSTGSGAGGSVATGSAKPDLATAKSSLGTIVVDGKGLTAYYFDLDKAGSGVSACTGKCLAAWPPITTTSAHPSVAGLTGKVGTISGPKGSRQLTINGRPICTFAFDKAPGDVHGQGSDKVWFVVSPAGDEIKTESAK